MVNNASSMALHFYKSVHLWYNVQSIRLQMRRMCSARLSILLSCQLCQHARSLCLSIILYALPKTSCFMFVALCRSWMCQTC